METVRRQEFDYEELVQDSRVDGRIYTDSDIFEDEIERIFHRWWIYVGHASQIPEPGDYQLTRIGRQPIIMSRDEDGEIHLLMNRCRHRGNSVCQYERGNANFFRCWYHGWTYNNKGNLVGVPYPKAYDESFRKEDYGLAKVARVGEHRGFIFGSLSPEGTSLDEHLGKAKDLIDLFVDQSPVGQIEVRSGSNKGKIKGNWKLIGMDGYHVEFVHRSIAMMEAREKASNFSDKTEAKGLATKNRSRDLGNGHVRLEYSGRLAEPERHLAPLLEKPWGRRYVEDLERAHGKERAQEMLCVKTPHVGIWPNLQLIDSHIRVIHPVSVDETQVTMLPATLKGVPEDLNIQRLRKHEWFYGPAGFGSPDDSEIFERNQMGMQAQVENEVLLARGMQQAAIDDDGSIVGNYADEITQRGQLRQWRQVMRQG